MTNPITREIIISNLQAKLRSIELRFNLDQVNHSPNEQVSMFREILQVAITNTELLIKDFSVTHKLTVLECLRCLALTLQEYKHKKYVELGDEISMLPTMLYLLLETKED